MEAMKVLRAAYERVEKFEKAGVVIEMRVVVESLGMLGTLEWWLSLL
jgi:hypothetical protein